MKEEQASVQNLQHVQVPIMDLKEEGVSIKDLLVYVCIKRYMNSETKTAFPSMTLIGKKASMSQPSVRKAINNLEAAKYLTRHKESGKSTVYKFNEYKHFEPFSYEFLDNDNLTANEKAYLIGAQQYMFKEPNTRTGLISYSNNELATKLNLDRHTVSKYNKSLEAKGYLDLIQLKKQDIITGFQIDEKIFQLDTIGQAVIFTLQDHNSKIISMEKDIKNLTKMVKLVMEENKLLKSKLSNTPVEDIIL